QHRRSKTHQLRSALEQSYPPQFPLKMRAGQQNAEFTKLWPIIPGTGGTVELNQMSSAIHDTDPMDHDDDASDALPARMPPAKVDLPRIERAVREILLAVGEDPDREGLRKTPNRVARTFAELFAGLQVDPRLYLRTVF